MQKTKYFVRVAAWHEATVVPDRSRYRPSAPLFKAVAFHFLASSCLCNIIIVIFQMVLILFCPIGFHRICLARRAADNRSCLVEVGEQTQTFSNKK